MKHRSWDLLEWHRWYLFLNNLQLENKLNVLGLVIFKDKYFTPMEAASQWVAVFFSC